MASVVGIISCFLPWIVVDAVNRKQHINGFHGYGIIVFMAFIVAGIICFSGDRHRTPGKKIWFMVITGIVALVFTVICLSNNNWPAGLTAKTGFGVWISLFAATAVITAGLFLKNPGTGLKTGLDGFRRSISIPIINAADLKANAGIIRLTELEKLTRLRANGDISEEEFNQLKSQLL
ncbi:MAG TPA: SHOCT domain-containing protein [Parafilimonas sp.]|nr:SHOCT domain-containing protein [Parafilimonas sp.]